MPIRFFCDHCKQMLKIGTSKVGSVVDCPRCKKSVVVPFQSAPQAEEWYQASKNKRSNSTAPPADTPPHDAGKNAPPIPTWTELEEEETEDINMPLWMEESWVPPSDNSSNPYTTLSANTTLAEEVAILALKKRHKLTVTFLNLSLVVVFFIGIVFGIFIRDIFFTTHTVSQPSRANAAVANEVTGTLYYINEDGERRADVDAVIICLPKDRQPSALLSCQGLRPADTMNNDTVQMLHEMGGMYVKADANGSFTFPYNDTKRYTVLLISANLSGGGKEMPLSVLQELRRYFRDPELFGENCLSIDEYEWADGKHSLRHTFESAE